MTSPAKCHAPPFPFELRDRRTTDDGFVVDAWLESHHSGSKQARRIRMSEYRDPQRRIVHRLLRRCICLVACDPESQDHLLGFVVGERAGKRLVLHYVYVRQMRRKHGLASRLVGELERRLGTSGITYTHETFLADRIIGRRIAEGLDARFNYYVALEEA